jgi:hypothetical protein
VSRRIFRAEIRLDLDNASRQQPAPYAPDENFAQ